MPDTNKVDVVIGGEIITLVSSEDEAYMQKLALYIDKRLAEIKSVNANASLSERTRTMFIAVNIADDYFKTLESLRRLEDEHERFVQEMGRMQEENYLLAEKMRELQGKLNAGPGGPVIDNRRQPKPQRKNNNTNHLQVVL